MRFGVLGPLAVWTDDGEPVAVPEAKVRLLLAVLLAGRGRPVSTDRLVEDLWGDRPPGDALAALRVKISQLRRVLGKDAITFGPAGYTLHAGSVDADRFHDLVAGKAFAEALALWRGPAFAGFEDAEFARAPAARLEEMRLAALEELAELRLERGEHAALTADLGDLVAAHPLRERLRAVHLRALYRAGRQGEALASYEDLRVRLADGLGVDPSPELAGLHQAILRQDPGLSLAERPRTNLPAPVSDLIGRKEAVTEVRAMLGRNRLVTLTGPGGVGKTRLALEAAAEPGLAFGGGVWLVELSSLNPGTAVEVTEAVAGALGLRDDGTEPVEQRLAGVLRGAETLLVLDNCEHVVDEVAALSGRLLRAAPGLRVLVTSQEPLRIAGEAAWSVPPLTLEAAVRLFNARAGLDGSWAGHEEDDAAVAEICARLDGIPLALELAATRARVLTPRQLADRLDDRFGLLAAGKRDAPARQRTLRAMIDWSWELLPDHERLVLRRLAVHADGCTLEAAEAVCAEPDLDVLPLLANLVDRSLVTRTPTGRYRLLESVAAYCRERLAEAGEQAAVELRHARHHAALAALAAPRLRGQDQRRWLAVLDAEAANLRTALETAVRQAKAPDLEPAVRQAAAQTASLLVGSLAWYWILRGRLGEAQRALESALTVSPDARTEVWLAGLRMLAGQGPAPGRRRHEEIADPLERARAGWFLAFSLFGYDDAATVEDLIGAALKEFEAHDDRWGVAATLSVRARLALFRGDLAALERDGERGLALFRETGDRWGEARAAENLATLAEITGDYARAEELRGEVLRAAEELGLAATATDALSKLGRIALLTGDLERAEDLHERARRLALAQSNRPAQEFAELGLAIVARRQGRLEEAERYLRTWLGWVREVAGDPGAAFILAELGFVAEQRGDAEAALGLHHEGLETARRTGDPRAVALALEGLAGAQSLRGDAAEAERLLAEAGELRRSVGAPLPPGERGDVDRIAARIRTL
ncbi:BTAD domain-containing putative transcriptional regulator [Nonomuraea sediminis]|uniref:BTAD domain-containing putative transcriptional regulator n=1 Tax=Nonomuraea sediminis TaxID=2835864 RepID=UPI001BDD24BA|nr:BTAD domain-containing putative transcriptional regulator [Nonomuraea sediminis]